MSLAIKGVVPEWYRYPSRITVYDRLSTILVDRPVRGVFLLHSATSSDLLICNKGPFRGYKTTQLHLSAIFKPRKSWILGIIVRKGPDSATFGP